MRYFRRLPPLLRVVSLLGLLCVLASLVLLVSVLVTSLRSFPSFSRSPLDDERRGIMALNLGLLGGACSVAVSAYTTRFRRPNRGPFPLNSWQSQVQAIALGAALPLCALAVALVAPLIPLPLDFVLAIVAAITVPAAIVLLIVTIWVPVRVEYS